MKTNKIMLLATIALFASCSNEEELGQLSNGNLTLTATMENATNLSRVGFDAISGALFWTGSDAFSVYTNYTENPWVTFTLNGTGGNSSGTFSGTLLGENAKASQYAVYPNILVPSLNNGSLSVVMPTEYDYGNKSDSEFGQSGISFNAPMLAQFTEFDATSTPNLSFKHLGGVFCFKLVNIPAGSDKFVFSVNKAITGSHTVDLTDASKPFIKTVTVDNETATTNNEVTIKFAANETVATTRVFYIPVPTGTYGKFTWKVYDDTEEKSSFTSSETASNEVERGTLVKMPTFTCANATGTITTEVGSAEALSNALSAGNSVVLTGEVTLDAKLEVNNDASIDLNGQSLNMGDNTIEVAVGKSLTLTNSGTPAAYSGRAVETAGITSSSDIITASAGSKIIIGEGVNLTTTGAGMCCIFVPGSDVNNIANNVTIESKGTLLATQAGAATIYVNGNVTSGTINISGGSVKHEADVAIYIAGNADLTISGEAEISGTTGVEVRAGSLTVENAKVSATGNPLNATPNGNGTTTVGAAIAISQHTTNYAIKAKIKDGTFEGVNALYEADLQAENQKATDVTLDVSGGTFNGEVYSASCSNFISGGTFTKASAFDYLANEASVVVGDDMTLTKAIHITNEATIDLNGKTIENQTAAITTGLAVTEDECFVFFVDGQYANLTINATNGGKVNAAGENDKSDYNVAVWATDNAKVTINGGEFTNAKDTDGDGCDLIYARGGATITINEGSFQSYIRSTLGGGVYDVLNCKDNTSSKITVNGGKFQNYVPSYENVGNDEVVLGNNKAVYNGEQIVETAHDKTSGDTWYEVKDKQD